MQGDDGDAVRPVRRISTVLPISCITSTLPVPVPLGRSPPASPPARQSDRVEADVIQEVARLLSAVDSSHVRLRRCAADAHSMLPSSQRCRELTSPHARSGLPAEASTTAGGALSQQLLEISPGAFSRVARPSSRANGACSADPCLPPGPENAVQITGTVCPLVYRSLSCLACHLQEAPCRGSSSQPGPPSSPALQP